MRNGVHLSTAIATALVAAAATTAAPTASARAMEEITVLAPHEVTVGRTYSGIPIKQITVQSRVGYGDLNLTTLTDAHKLRQRIRDAARVSCREIPVDVPVQGSSDRECIADAVDGAMTQANAVIASARARDAARYG
jgi:UrcA family protein